MKSLITVRPPHPTGTDGVDHSLLEKSLSRLEEDATRSLPDIDDDLERYLTVMQGVDPDRLGAEEALAFWLNVYNAAALRLATVAVGRGESTVLGVPGAFINSVITVASETLSLDGIEHGKIRRFADPRIHSGLVCGAVSCPTLRRQPFGGDVDGQLDDQMRRFLKEGAMRIDILSKTVVLNPIFSWFGADFTRPQRMPTILPARRTTVLAALTPWLDADTTEWIFRSRPRVESGSYDWRLGCAVG